MSAFPIKTKVLKKDKIKSNQDSELFGITKANLNQKKIKPIQKIRKKINN